MSATCGANCEATTLRLRCPSSPCGRSDIGLIRTIEAVLPAGLRWRLTAWDAGVLVLSTAVIFVVVYTSTGRELRGRIDRDLARGGGELAQVVGSRRNYNAAEITA